MKNTNPVIVVYGERMVDCSECGRQYVNEHDDCLTCSEGGIETVSENSIDRS